MPAHNYHFGSVKSVFVAGAGWFEPGMSIDGREILEIFRYQGRIYLATEQGAQSHVVRSHHLSVCLHVNYNEPEPDATDTVTGETGNDTIAG